MQAPFAGRWSSRSLVEVSMFDSLDDQIQKDENRVTTSGQRMMRYALYVLAAAVVMGGLIIGVHMMN